MKEQRLLAFAGGTPLEGFDSPGAANDAKKDIAEKLKKESGPEVVAEAKLVLMEAMVRHPAIGAEIARMIADHNDATTTFDTLKKKNADLRTKFTNEYKTPPLPRTREGIVSDMKTEIGTALTALQALETSTTPLHTDSLTKAEYLEHIKQIQNTEGLLPPDKDRLTKKFTIDSLSTTLSLDLGKAYLQAEGATIVGDNLVFEKEEGGQKLTITYTNTSGTWEANASFPDASSSVPLNNADSLDGLEVETSGGGDAIVAEVNRQKEIFQNMQSAVIGSPNATRAQTVLDKANEPLLREDNAQLEHSKVEQSNFFSETRYTELSAKLQAARKADPPNADALLARTNEMKALYETRKGEINVKIQDVLVSRPSNLVAYMELLRGQLKQLDERLDAELGIVRKTPKATPAAGPSPTPKDFDLQGKDKLDIGRLILAIEGKDDAKQQEALDALAKNVPEYSPTELQQKANAINKVLKEKGVKKEVKPDATGKKLELIDAKDPSTDKPLTKKEEKELRKLNEAKGFIELLKDFFQWIRDLQNADGLARGDLGAMRIKSANLQKEIDTLKGEPGTEEKVLALQKERAALEARIIEQEAKNKAVVDAGNRHCKDIPNCQFDWRLVHGQPCVAATNYTPEAGRQVNLFMSPPQMPAGCLPVAAMCDGRPAVIFQGPTIDRSVNLGNRNNFAGNVSINTGDGARISQKGTPDARAGASRPGYTVLPYFDKASGMRNRARMASGF